MHSSITLITIALCMLLQNSEKKNSKTFVNILQLCIPIMYYVLICLNLSSRCPLDVPIETIWLFHVIV